ncbi:MAG: hypothetical protein Q7V48_15825 [Deltaproteobacteria bacterium]|nr:hypothetical protein [Deltaproteobacteria bacterium]
MITSPEEEFIKNYAYVPEHMPGYGSVMSGGEPFLLEDYLCYKGKELLIFVGFPLKGTFNEKKVSEVLEVAVKRFKPAQVALIAPTTSLRSGKRSETDIYYKLDLVNLKIRSKLKNMIQRASRELGVEKGREFKDEHRHLVKIFLSSRDVGEETRAIFERIPKYISLASTVWIFSARDRAGNLLAFDVAEFGAINYAFYMFNFRSRQHHVPGASDLLLHALIREAEQQGKTYVNLGLGVNQGVAFFKKKWGGQPFLNHEFLLYRPSSPTLFDSLLQGFSKS